MIFSQSWTPHFDHVKTISASLSNPPAPNSNYPQQPAHSSNHLLQLSGCIEKRQPSHSDRTVISAEREEMCTHGGSEKGEKLAASSL